MEHSMKQQTLQYECPVCKGDIDEIKDFDHFGDYTCPHCEAPLYIGINTETHELIIWDEKVRNDG